MARGKKIKAIFMIEDKKGGYILFDSLSEKEKEAYFKVVAEKAGKILSEMRSGK